MAAGGKIRERRAQYVNTRQTASRSELMSKKGERGKKAKKADDERDTVTLRITAEDRADFTELFRLSRAAGVDEISVYIKQLLNRFLHRDPSSEKAVWEMLRDLHDATSSLQERFEKLDTRTKRLHDAVAKSTAILLVKAANWPPEQAQKWVQEKLLG